MGGIQYANGAYLGTPNTAVDSSGRDYQMAIPTGVPLKLWLFSTDVALSDAAENPIKATTAVLIPFQASAGQDQIFAFSVAGPAAH